MLAADVMTEAVRADADASVRDVAALMREADTGVVFLVRDDAPVAVITDRDLALSVVAEERGHDDPAVVHASSPVLAVTPATELAEAADRMARYDCRRLAVLEDRRLVGVVALDDVVAAQGEAPARV